MQNTHFEVTPEGGLIWQDKDALKSYLYSLPPGSYYLMAVRTADKRSLEQNALLWRRYTQIANYMTAAGVIKNESGEPIELDAETIHNYCKDTPELNDLLPKNFVLTTDESGNYLVKKGKGSTTKLSRNALDMLAFSDYYEAVGAHFQTNFPNLQLD